MDIDFYYDYENHSSIMVIELYELYEGVGNIIVEAYFKKVNNKKIYYDFQRIDMVNLKGSCDKVEVLELIHYLEEQL